MTASLKKTVTARARFLSIQECRAFLVCRPQSVPSARQLRISDHAGLGVVKDCVESRTCGALPNRQSRGLVQGIGLLLSRARGRLQGSAVEHNSLCAPWQRRERAPVRLCSIRFCAPTPDSHCSQDRPVLLSLTQDRMLQIALVK